MSLLAELIVKFYDSMQTVKEIHLDGVGTVAFHKVKGARRVIIRVPPFRPVRVTVPYRVSFQNALAFVQRSRGWILQQQALARRIESQSGDLIARMRAMDTEQAKRRLTRRLEQLADAHGFRYGRVTIRHQKTRWGSCSYKNNISLNIQLACLPAHLQDYVVLHELVHTKVKNHGPAFWKALNHYVPNAKAVQAELRRYPIIDKEILARSQKSTPTRKAENTKQPGQLAFQFD